MRTSISDRVNKHRAALRASGLRPIQIWVPDTKSASFVEECRRQSFLVSDIDRHDENLMHFMDGALLDIDGWKA